MIFLLWLLVFAIALILELWFRFRIRGHNNYIVAKDSKQPDDSFYLFENPKQMENHPVYLKYCIGDKNFFDELQISHKLSHVSPVESRNVVGANINIVNGERTTWRPKPETLAVEASDHWILLGGSTVLCLEVPDSMTSTSCIQALVDRSSNKTVQVHNFGQAGFKAVKVNQLFPLFLSKYENVTNVIIYFGVKNSFLKL